MLQKYFYFHKTHQQYFTLHSGVVIETVIIRYWKSNHLTKISISSKQVVQKQYCSTILFFALMADKLLHVCCKFATSYILFSYVLPDSIS